MISNMIMLSYGYVHIFKVLERKKKIKIIAGLNRKKCQNK